MENVGDFCCLLIAHSSSSLPFRSKMPDKTDEERERIAKKLAEQRAKIEGMPTTAKVSIIPAILHAYMRKQLF